MNAGRRILFWHGLESGPHGSKYRALCDAGYEVIAPDSRGLPLRERVDVVMPLLRELRRHVVGSSYGGITAILAGMCEEVALPGLVLCAPACERQEEPNTDPVRLRLVGPTVIVHGVEDEMVPIEVSRRYASRTGAKLIEVADGHRLAGSQASGSGRHDGALTSGSGRQDRWRAHVGRPPPGLNRSSAS